MYEGGIGMIPRIGTGELLVILAVALIVVGPNKLPDLGRSVGKAFGEFKKFSDGIKEEISLEDKDSK